MNKYNEVERSRSVTCPKCHRVSLMKLTYKSGKGWIGKCSNCGQKVQLVAPPRELVRNNKGVLVRGKEKSKETPPGIVSAGRFPGQ